MQSLKSCMFLFKPLQIAVDFSCNVDYMKFATFALFRFIRGRGEDGRKFLDEQFVLLKKQPGLVRGFISQGAGDPDSFFIFTEWKDEDSHNKMIRKLQELLNGGTAYIGIMPILAAMPVMESYKIVKE